MERALVNLNFALWSIIISPELEIHNLRSHFILIKFSEVLVLFSWICVKSFKELTTSYEHWIRLLWLLGCLRCLRCIS